jgi:hypothetical protein
MRERILHPCKRRSVVSWLLKLFESPAPMRTLRSKLRQLHEYLLDHPNTRIQSRHFPNFTNMADTLYNGKVHQFLFGWLNDITHIIAILFSLMYEIYMLLTYG